MSHQQNSSTLLQSPNSHHHRQQSIGNLLPQRILAQAPSLIALVDRQSQQQSNKQFSFKLRQQDKTPIESINEEEINPKSQNKLPPIQQNEILEDDIPLQKQSSEDSLNTIDDIDLQQLAIQAAQEFITIANENDSLVVKNQKLEVEIDDLKHRIKDIDEEINLERKHHKHGSELESQLSEARSNIINLELQIQVLTEQVQTHEQTIQEYEKNKSNMDTIAPLANLNKLNHGNNHPLHNRMGSTGFVSNENEDKTLVKLEKLEKENLDYEDEIKKLQKEIREMNKILLQEQNNNKILLEQLQEKDELLTKFEIHENNEIKAFKNVELQVQETQKQNEQLNTRMRKLTTEQNEYREREAEMIARLEEQKNIIQELEQERHDLETVIEEIQTQKIRQDDDMFSLLKDLKGLHNKQQKTLLMNSNSQDLIHNNHNNNNNNNLKLNHHRQGSQSMTNVTESNGVEYYALGQGIDNRDSGLYSIRGERAMKMFENETEVTIVKEEVEEVPQLNSIHSHTIELKENQTPINPNNNNEIIDEQKLKEIKELKEKEELNKRK